MAQQPAGIRWLHVHPKYLITDEVAEILWLARRWGEGLMPLPGGLWDQPARIVAAIEIVRTAWAKLEAERLRKLKEK